MQVKLPTDFIYPTFFFIGGRATGNAAQPVEPVGVFITKQTVLTNGIIPSKDHQVEVFTKDTLYQPFPFDDSEAENRLEIQFESDLAAYKPNLDLVIVRADFSRGVFGKIRINRQDGNGFQPNPGWRFPFGWLSRASEEDHLADQDLGVDLPPFEENPRKSLAGSNLDHFQPDKADKYKLPENFKNDFFNGGRLRGINHLRAGNTIDFADFAGGLTVQVKIPPGPNLQIKVGDGTPPPIGVNADTVIYDESAQRFLVIWRAIFSWETHLENAVLEVN